MKLFVALLALLLSSCTKVEDQTRGISKICPVHKVAMERRNAGFEKRAEGYLRLTRLVDLAGSIEAYEQAEASVFPFARTTRAVLDFEKNPPERIVIFVCPKCVTALDSWQKEKGANQALQPTPMSVTPPAAQEPRRP